MAKRQLINYTFDASAQTITLTDYTTIRLDSILLITNVTDNVIIYNFADATKGGTVATNVLTLTYDTTSMADADKLLIYYDDYERMPLEVAGGAQIEAVNSGHDSLAVYVDNPLTISNEVIVDGFEYHDDPDADGGVFKMGSIATTSEPAAVANGDACQFYVDATGHQHVKVDSNALPTGASTAANQQTDALTDTELRATAVPVSAASLPLPAGAATSASQQTDALTDTELRATPVPVSGTVTANLSATDNAVLDAIEADTTTIAGDTTSIDGKITACNTGAVTVSAALPAGTNAIGKLAANSGVDIGDVDVTTIPGIEGDVAHDAADSGSPVKIGGKAYNQDGTVPGTAVAEGDRANFITDVYGRQFVETSHPNLWSASADYAAAQTNATVKAAPGAGLSLYITDIIISNGATAGNITLLDGSGGTVKFELYAAITGGVAHSLRTPIKLTANTLLAITSTTVTTHSVTISGFTAP